MAGRVDQSGEGTTFKANNTTNNTTNNIDALQVESANKGAGSRSAIASSSLTFDQASSIAFIISLMAYLWYIVPLMLAFIGEVFMQNQLNELYGDYDYDWWEDIYETYMSYFVPFLIASILFVIATLIQIYVWFAKIFGRDFGEMYKNICLVNMFLSFVGCICQGVAIGNLEDDTVGDINTDNKSDDQIAEITYYELLYGGFFVVYALYNVYFTSLLFPAVYENQFIRLSIACAILIVHCGFYVPFFIDECNDYTDNADDYDEWSKDYGDFYRNMAGGYGVTAAGLIIVIIACIVIIIRNIENSRSGEELTKISQLTVVSKRIYMKCIVGLVVGLIVYLVGLGTTMSIVSWGSLLRLITFYVGIYILLGAIVIAVDFCFCYYAR